LEESFNVLMKHPPKPSAVCHQHVSTTIRVSAIAIIATLSGLSSAMATDFSVKRICDFTLPAHAPVRKVCIISGRMDRTSVDFQIETPDGGLYTIEGRRDGEGLGFLLDGHPAVAHGDCYVRTDQILTICLGETVN
jgi:hypothetical protein